MKRSVGFALILAFLFIAIPVFAQDSTTLTCNEVKIVLQHKILAVKLTLVGTISMVTDGDGLKRCASADEILKSMAAYPDYYISEYGEVGLQ
ncbi:MAG: hypothetical protein Q8R40_06675 [bacterium]|nr:hypothetical protein [bacterium]